MPKPAGSGQIKISNDVVAEMVGFAVLECYGVVGMANPNFKAGVSQLLSRDKLTKGVVIDSSGGAVEVELYVVIEYGTNLAEVSRNLVDRVRYVLEKYAQIKVGNVAVHVQDIRVHETS